MFFMLSLGSPLAFIGAVEVPWFDEELLGFGDRMTWRPFDFHAVCLLNGQVGLFKVFYFSLPHWSRDLEPHGPPEN